MNAPSGEAAVANGRAVSRYDVGYCQMFVRDQCWRLPSLYGSAIEAWNGARYKHPGDRHPPIGAPCFYRGGQYGHVVIYTAGAGTAVMRSTDCPTNGHVSEADLDWPSRAWNHTYLGWTEDLNGVRLPLGDDAMNEDDWARMEALVMSVWEDKMTVTQPGTGDDVKKSRQQVLREVWQKVTKST